MKNGIRRKFGYFSGLCQVNLCSVYHNEDGSWKMIVFVMVLTKLSH